MRRGGGGGLSNCRPKIGCFEASNAKRHLMTTLRMGQSKDLKPFTNLVLETSAEVVLDDGTIKEDEVGQIMLSETLPIVEAPDNGRTLTSADKYCGATLRSSSAASGCARVPGVDLSSQVASCRSDLVHSGDSRVAGLHLERLVQDCRDSVFRNASMWAMDEAAQRFELPRRKLADRLCLNACSRWRLSCSTRSEKQ